MDEDQTPLSGLTEAQLEELLVRTASHAAWKLGGRAGHSPDMAPDELTSRALTDTLAGRRRFDPTERTLKLHLIGTVESYISHYFDSLEAKSRGDQDSKPEPFGADPITAEDVLAQRDLNRLIEEAVRKQERKELTKIHDLIINKGLSLKNDSALFCEELDLDPTTKSPGWQRFNRLRNKFQEIASAMHAFHGQTEPGVKP